MKIDIWRSRCLAAKATVLLSSVLSRAVALDAVIDQRGASFLALSSYRAPSALREGGSYRAPEALREGEDAQVLVAALPSERETQIGTVHVQIWEDHSEIPVTVETIIALIFMLMIVSFPFHFSINPGSAVTKADWISAAFTFAMLVLMVFLFTNVVIFTSSHFREPRTLTIVECIYLMAQILTTVGYGDITPAYPRGQVFVGLYVVLCLLLIADVVIEMVNAIAAAAARRAKELTERALHFQVRRAVSHACSSSRRLSRLLPGRSQEGLDHRTSSSTDDAGSAHPLTQAEKVIESVDQEEETIHEHAKMRPVLSHIKAVTTYVLCVIAGVVFYSQYPGEGKTMGEALYMSTITLSTVGFGAITPQTEGGMVFGAFWMLVGSCAFVWMLGSFSEMIVAMRERELYDAAEHHEHLNKLKEEKIGQKLDKFEFLKFHILQSGAMSESALELIETAFAHLHKEGQVSIEDIEKSMPKLPVFATPRRHDIVRRTESSKM